jgi:hypothetical protein
MGLNVDSDADANEWTFLSNGGSLIYPNIIFGSSKAHIK